MWITRWAAATLFLLAWISPAQAPNGPTQKISVRLVDVSNGHVYANETIRVQFHIPQVSELQTLEGKTAADGIAEFHFPEPISSKIAASATNERLYPCYRSFPIDIETIIRDGLDFTLHQTNRRLPLQIQRTNIEDPKQAGGTGIVRTPANSLGKISHAYLGVTTRGGKSFVSTHLSVSWFRLWLSLRFNEFTICIAPEFH